MPVGLLRPHDCADHECDAAAASAANDRVADVGTRDGAAPHAADPRRDRSRARRSAVVGEARPRGGRGEIDVELVGRSGPEPRRTSSSWSSIAAGAALRMPLHELGEHERRDERRVRGESDGERAAQPRARGGTTATSTAMNTAAPVATRSCFVSPRRPSWSGAFGCSPRPSRPAAAARARSCA